IEGKHAVSRYRVMKIHEDAGKPFAVQLEVETLTGRKHQVRIHCAHGLGRPIILDPLYGQDGSQQLSDRISKLEKELNGMREMFFLHAAQISIPEFGITAKAPPPVLLVRGIGSAGIILQPLAMSFFVITWVNITLLMNDELLFGTVFIQSFALARQMMDRKVSTRPN
ncbi:hypothetical protein THAOC_27207, partial [Thalassiosira oceanica]